jgi:3',5'-cyclic AMP phosphodiesterase CpdA
MRVKAGAVLLLVALMVGGPAFGRDLTFIVWSDTHFGAYDYSDTTRLKVIEQMNRLPGRKYPAEIFADAAVGRPAFLLHLGDITEHGLADEWNDPNIADQRSYLRTIRHLTATDKTYEAAGNHDSLKLANIRRQIARKQGGTYYAFDAQGVHFVVLDPYTDPNTAAPSLDGKQLDWLRADLDKIAAAAPVVIAMHEPPRRGGTDVRSRAADNSFEHLWNIIADRNVLAFLHGHFHVVLSRQWFEFDTVEPAGFAYLRRGCPQGDPVFGVVRITDDRMTVCGWDWEKEQFLEAPVFDRSVSSGQAKGSADRAQKPEETAGHP